MSALRGGGGGGGGGWGWFELFVSVGDGLGLFFVFFVGFCFSGFSPRQQVQRWAAGG